MATTYDFIVVGSGPAGSTVAASLARASSRPEVLLLEAGGSNEDRNLRVDGQRWITLFHKDMNWGYKTTPQIHSNDRELHYPRGKGLGGSSAINFGIYSIGARGDYDEWARIVGDDAFRWERMQPRFKSLETFHSEIPADVDKKYVNPKASDHGTSGPLHVAFPSEWEKDVPELLEDFERAGFPLNQDHNSGNPIGMSAAINSSYKGHRVTAADLLVPRPDNLTVIVNAPVQRLILKDKKAVGVESNGKQYFASKEVVLSAGALDTPKILMHSGIGPAHQLEAYNIPVVLSVPAIGSGLRDHWLASLIYTRVEGNADRAAFYGDQKVMDDALEQWKRDSTGPWAKFYCQLGIGWFKLDQLVSSEEFQGLPDDEKRYLLHETVPHYEILSNFPVHFVVPQFPQSALNYSCVIAYLYNAQARGEVLLQSSDPNVPLLYDPKFLSHPFDRRAAIESLRETLRFANSESYKKDTLAAVRAPKSDSDEDLLEYWKQNGSSSWHMTGTVKMGKPEDSDAAVDAQFKLKGIDGLRIADMSVVPVLASCHVQAVAYVTGLTCAEKLIEEYKL